MSRSRYDNAETQDHSILWFDTQAEEAAKFYLSVFKEGKITATSFYGPEGPGPKGSVMTVAFEINGQESIALKWGPEFQIHRGDLIRYQLRVAKGSRLLLGKPCCRWRRARRVRLAQG